MYFNDRDGEKMKITPDEQQGGRACTHSKKLCMEHQHNTVSPSTQQRRSGEKNSNPTPRSHSPSVSELKCGCKSIPPKPSTVTSNSSFKTANNEDAGFIKLMDDVGQEAGKFYIGASGFIKDNDYEVVIQLRKKGDDREISNENPEDKTKKNQEELSNIDKVSVITMEASATQTSVEANNETSKNKIEPVATISTTTDLPLETKKSKDQGLTIGAVVNKAPEILTNPNLKQSLPSGDAPRSSDNDIINEQNTVSEIGVTTSFQDTYAFPPNVPKTDPTPRPATSIYTQTSMSSPNHRPVFFHMSSSTSTAYMSPPEMILPKFLMQDYRLTDEEYPRNYDMEENELTGNHDNTDEYDCRCKKCSRRLPTSQNIKSSIHQCRKFTLENARTPPNSTRSIPSEKGEHIYLNEEHNFVPTKKKSKCKCSKCNHNRVYNDDKLVSPKKTQHLSTAKNSLRNQIMGVSSSAASSNKENVPTSKRSTTNLKPAIKKYVDKLLVLNKESLKAVQVIDQECSSVTTPGSSIIDVPNNLDQYKPDLENKLSLQKIKVMLRQKIVDDSEKKDHNTDDGISNQNSEVCLEKQSNKNIKIQRCTRKKTAHKVKSLNISKHLYKDKKIREMRPAQIKLRPSLSTKGECIKEKTSSIPSRTKMRSKSSPTPRLEHNAETTDKCTNSDLPRVKRNDLDEFQFKLHKTKCFDERKSEVKHIGKWSKRVASTNTSTSPDSDGNQTLLKRNNVEIPMSISTQTSINVDSEINFMKLADNKLQNMEKIADLTEKCTQRLSNLAKVLEEVRKNKTLVYSQISSSDATSDSDQKSDKNSNRVPTPSHEPFNDVNKRSESNSPLLANTVKIDTYKENDNTIDSTDYIPFLSDIPKPAFKSLNSDFGINSSSSSSKKSNSPLPVQENFDFTPRNRGRPPPALSRIHLKHEHDFVVPHELSTVVEVDSPMSVKLKSSRNDTKFDVPDTSNRNNNEIRKDVSTNPLFEVKTSDAKKNPDLLDSNVEISDEHQKMNATETSENSKVQMIDMRQFNEIMLKPFFSIQEYAKQCNVGVLEDGSNLDDIVKDDHINDELSSLHSEASLPDVISELLKRNIISEPFRFDTGSNNNSTTVSSESTISVLALSKTRQAKNKLGVILQDKENGETSDTLSISSNPDLENAFKKLGMGWASSTLKKTKERLALSSSSNTSTSSLSQFKIKSFNQDVPVLLTDTVSSVLNYSKKPRQRIAAGDRSKHAEQQTSLSNSMTVKEFLTNELAKKITFDNKSRDESEEFVSLFETKMPEEMKHSSQMVREENSIDSTMRSGNNRARTSTPVQLFKSMTYHSSSSSNISNGFFSNADDLSSVKVTSNSMKHSTSDKDDLIIPNFSLRMKKGSSENSKNN